MTAKDQTSKSDQILKEKVVTVGYDQRRLKRGLSRILSFESPDLSNSDNRVKRSDHDTSEIKASLSSKLGGVNNE